MPKVAVLAILKNEVEALPKVCAELKSLISEAPYELHLIFVDGWSTDGSFEFLVNEGFHVLRESKPGAAWAVRDGFNEARKLQSDVIVAFQPDGNCDSRYLLELVNLVLYNQCSLAIGSRYMCGSKSDDDTLVSMIGNSLFRIMFRIRFPSSSLRDPIVGYRAFKTSLVDELDLLNEQQYRWLERLVFSRSLSYDVLMTTRCLARSLPVIEISAPEPKRIGGKAKKQTMRWGIAYTIQLWVDSILVKFSNVQEK